MKFYRNWREHDISKAFMNAEEVLDRYLYYPAGLCKISEVQTDDIALAVIDENLKPTPDMIKVLKQACVCNGHEPRKYTHQDGTLDLYRLAELALDTKEV